MAAPQTYYRPQPQTSDPNNKEQMSMPVMETNQQKQFPNMVIEEKQSENEQSHLLNATYGSEEL